MKATHFLVHRQRLREHRLVEEERGPLASGEVELRIERFGLTSNNVTYGVMGESLSYFRFFPAPEPEWGRLPVWGFGVVTRSAADGVAVGERFYGYFPMSSHLVVAPEKVGDAGFVDGAPHRRGLGGVYNQYLRTTRDPSYRADTEGHQVVLRPVFATAVFLADFLQESDFFGATSVLVSSASSKLGYATAFMLGSGARRRVVGLTSSRNVDFVNRLGLYDQVVRYEEVTTLPAGESAVYVDLSGDARVRSAVHHHLGDALRYSSAIGATHWESLGAGWGAAEPLPGPKPVVFFAPAWIKRRSDEWGAAEVQRRLGEAWATFVQKAADPARAWMTLAEGEGGEAVAATYDALTSGEARPDQGYVLSLGGQ